MRYCWRNERRCNDAVSICLAGCLSLSYIVWKRLNASCDCFHLQVASSFSRLWILGRFQADKRKGDAYYIIDSSRKKVETGLTCNSCLLLHSAETTVAFRCTNLYYRLSALEALRIIIQRSQTLYTAREGKSNVGVRRGRERKDWWNGNWGKVCFVGFRGIMHPYSPLRLQRANDVGL